MTNPLVSVCIPTYKGAAFLAAAIDSVLHQTYPYCEVWILDDNSPDNTRAVVENYSDSRVRYRHCVRSWQQKIFACWAMKITSTA